MVYESMTITLELPSFLDVNFIERVTINKFVSETAEKISFL